MPRPVRLLPESVIKDSVYLLSTPGPSHIARSNSALLRNLTIPYSQDKINSATFYDSFQAQPKQGTPMIAALRHEGNNRGKPYILERGPLYKRSAGYFGYACVHLIRDARRFLQRCAHQGWFLPRYFPMDEDGTIPEQRYIFEKFDEETQNPQHGRVVLKDSHLKTVIDIDFKDPEEKGSRLSVGWENPESDNNDVGTLRQIMKIDSDGNVKTERYKIEVTGFDVAAHLFGLLSPTLIGQALELTSKIYSTGQFDDDSIHAVQIGYQGKARNLIYKNGRFELPADIDPKKLKRIAIRFLGTQNNLVYIKFDSFDSMKKVLVHINRDQSSPEDLLKLNDHMMDLLWKPVRRLFPK